MRFTSVTILLEFETLRIILFVFLSRVVAALTGRASQRDHDPILFTFAWHLFLRSSWCNLPRPGAS